MCKCDFNYEKYLDCISNNNVKRCFSQFRIFSHHLEIELGRYNNIGRYERKCKLCNCNMVESEYHFLLCCPIYNDLRRKYNIRCNWPNLTRFKHLLSRQNVKVINNLANCISERMKIREEKLLKNAKYFLFHVNLFAIFSSVPNKFFVKL